MDLSGATSKIEDTVENVKKIYEKIKEKYNTAATKINHYIDELQQVIDKLITAGEQAIEWAKMKIKKILKKISDALDNLKKIINDKIEQLTTWYNESVKKVKINTVKGVYAKIGATITNEQAEPFADLIPHPKIESFISPINIELQLPNIDNLFSLNYSFELGKLPLI